VPTPHASGLAFLGTVKTPSKPVGAYRPPGARGAMTPLHFKREDEGGAAHTVSNGTPSIGPNGFGRPRHLVPGAEPAGRPAVPGAIPVDEGKASKNKKKRNKKAKEGEAAGAAGAPTEGGLAPSPREYGSASGNEGRSPDRRGQQHARSRSRHNNNNAGTNNNNNLQPGGRNRSNTQRNRSRSRPAPAVQAGGGAPVSPAVGGDADGGAAAAAAANPNAKKIRALQKKIRAIEDLEMRLAGGEKLEETQVKKINTKKSVIDELAGLGEQA
jgi:translation initiation factor 2A